MKTKRIEPRRLSRGKKVHSKLQKEWIESSAGHVTAEKPVVKPKPIAKLNEPRGPVNVQERKGRVDVFVELSDENDKPYFAVVEIKNSNWDRMNLEAVRRNVERQASQIWDYVESKIEDSDDSLESTQLTSQGKGKTIDLTEHDIFPGVVFPKRPRDHRRRDLIERLFEKRGISVVWDDESIQERRARP